MSALLLVLLSGLTMFGVSIMEPSEIPDEEPEEAEGRPAAPVEGGSNPLDLALSAEGQRADSETGDGSDEQVREDTDDTDRVDPEADTITGSDGADAINAGAGDDIVDGGAGADSITGGTGADSIEGGLGADVLYGGMIDGLDDGAADTLSGGAGDDEINLGNDDMATGAEGADSFIRSDTVTSRVLVTDFDSAEDVIVVQHQSDTPPVLDRQVVASDGVILDFSDGSQIELEGLTDEIDETLISFVDIRQT